MTDHASLAVQTDIYKSFTHLVNTILSHSMLKNTAPHAPVVLKF